LWFGVNLTDMFFVYIIQCKDNFLYTGITNNLEKRIREHNLGIGSPVTKNRGPVKLVYFQEFSTREEAAVREKEIKGWRRGKKEIIINQN